MKKLSLILIISLIGLSGFSQGLFHKVTPAIFKGENKKDLKVQTLTLNGAWVWRIDATIALNETVYHSDTKTWVSNPFSAIGPGIQYAHFVPSITENPTPINNYGFGAAVCLGENIYKPSFTSVKFVLQGNLWQYFKGGITATLNTKSWFGWFIGTGITF